MTTGSVRTLLVRNFGFWAVAAVLYPVAHWIPSATGQPPRIFDVLVPVLVVGLGLASNAYLGTAIDKGRHCGPLSDAEPGKRKGEEKRGRSSFR